ncbi:MAG: hypothetical protein IPK84_03115 [Candidatus Moraniibacteriota bacterium]|nr:MAG: hypothetical protein IPK84_03115 [Candidatus Moranbacteria bacterium]
MYSQSLEHAGLRPEQAILYEALLKKGSSSAGALHKDVPLKRGLVYKVLDELAEAGLIDRREEPGKTTLFEVRHPLRLKELAERREEEAKNAKLALEGVLPAIISDYNLVSGKPGVLVYEGIDGIKTILEDTLDHNPEKKLFTFSDLAGYIGSPELRKWNKAHYAPKRNRLGIYEKAIVPNTEAALEFLKGYQASEVTEILLLDHKAYPFKTEVNIYSGKVSFVTFSEKSLVGVLIENQEIYETFRSLFSFIWSFGRKHCQDIQPNWTERFSA